MRIDVPHIIRMTARAFAHRPRRRRGCGRKGDLDRARQRRRRRKKQRHGEADEAAGSSRQALRPRPASLIRPRRTTVNHFHYRDGVLTPRTSPLPRSPRRSARRSTAIRPRRWSGTIRVFSEAFADVDALVCYAMKANSNQAVLKTLAGSAPASTSSPRANCAARWPPAFRPNASCSPASARRRARWISRSTPASTASTSNPSRNWKCSNAARRRAGQDARRLLPHQSRCRCRHPCQDLDRQEGKQVRHLL